MPHCHHKYARATKVRNIYNTVMDMVHVNAFLASLTGPISKEEGGSVVIHYVHNNKIALIPRSLLHANRVLHIWNAYGVSRTG